MNESKINEHKKNIELINNSKINMNDFIRDMHIIKNTKETKQLYLLLTLFVYLYFLISVAFILIFHLYAHYMSYTKISLGVCIVTCVFIKSLLKFNKIEKELKSKQKEIIEKFKIDSYLINCWRLRESLAFYLMNEEVSIYTANLIYSKKDFLDNLSDELKLLTCFHIMRGISNERKNTKMQ